ncbi:MAG TPA: 16S rRNA (uracil(1498)-N(3))-methyltransferase [Bacteroidia bacterium]|jgi:16S rRNA (uracil1498-N3)-methyltransferase|nr:16S rRNA (uracil(1498)-N(3))-methyltransferase [Bacteroidia bacterium]HRG51905.1 16S rRNA (uracil(1498)-N(3))-methyltransferase [Bacteroidia bacterium]
MHLFYTPDISLPEYTLNEEESKHCIRVLRLGIGDKIVLLDGKGGWYEGEIISDHPKRCGIKILNEQKEVGKHAYQLQLAIAPTKNMDRLEWFGEKATEIGIDGIALLHCQNSERDVVKTERLEKVLISAMKQSMNAYLPQLSDMTDFKKYIAGSKTFAGQKFIAHCYDAVTNTNKPHLKHVYSPKANVLILIGPEGDFSIDEVKYALENGFQEISLGTSRLRTETAALAACLTVHILNS